MDKPAEGQQPQQPTLEEIANKLDDISKRLDTTIAQMVVDLAEIQRIVTSLASPTIAQGKPLPGREHVVRDHKPKPW